MKIEAGTLTVVVGGQYGSEGKGAIAGWLTSDKVEQPTGGDVLCIRVAGPNAGHTVMGRGPDGEAEGSYPWRLRSVPVSAVTNEKALLAIAAGSEIDMEVLTDELTRLDKAGYNATERLVIDGQATMLTEEHKAQEAEAGLVEKLGSTGKGIGAARAARLMRKATLAHSVLEDTMSVESLIRQVLPTGHVVIEGTQGYGLGLHAGHYPQCTSSNTRAIDFCAMAGAHPLGSWTRDYKVWVVLRTFPIRVSGNSGPLDDETTWAALGLDVELTTVTQKVRRVGLFDFDLAAAAIRGNGGPAVCDIALTMFDYVFPEYKNRHGWLYYKDLSDEAQMYIAEIEDQTGATVKLLGTSPNTVLEVIA